MCFSHICVGKPGRMHDDRPYREDGRLTPQQVKFNNILSAARSVSERAFGRLKGKFRRLKFLDIGIVVTSSRKWYMQHACYTISF
ncbi:unnamed protein product [Ixodes pacificus]